MNGLKYAAPMSCKHENCIIAGELTLFGETPDRDEKCECEGCKTGNRLMHNGRYARVMDWITSKPLRFVDLV